MCERKEQKQMPCIFFSFFNSLFPYCTLSYFLMVVKTSKRWCSSLLFSEMCLKSVFINYCFRIWGRRWAQDFLHLNPNRLWKQRTNLPIVTWNKFVIYPTSVWFLGWNSFGPWSKTFYSRETSKYTLCFGINRALCGKYKWRSPDQSGKPDGQMTKVI